MTLKTVWGYDVIVKANYLGVRRGFYSFISLIRDVGSSPYTSSVRKVLRLI
jgi:hypothetical protein